ncbi:hypothetical protein L2E82_11365 [Cichorium intybus]|uniref:Uncharacterized protein n=1 Tax=Cichorium intybus TaxID=13427 RepID=A0ACB9GDA1_CICIN|nr:hypothetical protein L2E82_11365 [Cichorium intybus]
MPLGVWPSSAFKKIGLKWGEVIYIDSDDCGAICNGKVCIRVKKDVMIEGSILINFEGIFHEVIVKEVGCWIPTVNEGVTSDQETGDEEEDGEFIRDEDDEDFNSNDESCHLDENIPSDELKRDGVLKDGKSPIIEQNDRVSKSCADIVNNEKLVETGDHLMGLNVENKSSNVHEKPCSRITKAMNSGNMDSCGSSNKRSATGNNKNFKKVSKLSLSSTSGSKGQELISLLNGLETEMDGQVVIEKMGRFIEIGEMLGYDMNGCSETREQLIKIIVELNVNQ